jgi:hypothetical protein
MYGSGVYFARDSLYSTKNSYSPPNANQEKIMFSTRVCIGHSSVGKGDMKTPPVRLGDIAFDSLVDSLANPSIFVSGHHDAQCYSEHRVTFYTGKAPPPVEPTPSTLPPRHPWHTHDLALSSNASAWICDGRYVTGGCRGSGGNSGPRYHCSGACDYDLCLACWVCRS